VPSERFPRGVHRDLIVRRFLANIGAHWRRIGLFLSIAALLVVAYRYRVLPARADVLLDCFLYLSVATTFTPLPALPPIVHAATQAPVFLVAAVAAAGTAVAYLLEYSALGRLMAHERLERVQRTRMFLRLAAAFDRLPFVALIVAAFLPLPVDGVRLMAIARRYDRRRYALAAFLGRLPRYALMAGLGYGLRGFVPFAMASDAVSPVTAALAAPADAASSTDPVLRDVLARLDQAAGRLNQAHGRFRQERWSPAFAEPERSRGELWFRRPGDLVLRYDEPDEQELYVDSLGIWIYLVKQKQAQRYPFASPAERDAALAVLWQPSNVIEPLYALSRAAAPPPGEAPGQWLRLVPRDPELAEVVAVMYMRVAETLGLSDCVVVEQRSGERVRLEVDRIKRNPGLKDRHFRFVPPPGVEVVRF